VIAFEQVVSYERNSAELPDPRHCGIFCDLCAYAECALLSKDLNRCAFEILSDELYPYMPRFTSCNCEDARSETIGLGKRKESTLGIPKVRKQITTTNNIIEVNLVAIEIFR
jgi:hypothetical protein